MTFYIQTTAPFCIFLLVLRLNVFALDPITLFCSARTFLWLFLIYLESRTLGEGKLCWVPCSIKMGTLVEPALMLLLWQGVWALDIPLEGESVICVIQYKINTIFSLVSNKPLYHSACSQAAPYHHKAVNEGAHRWPQRYDGHRMWSQRKSSSHVRAGEANSTAYR